ncbi:protein YAE1 homolog isoform X2 [Ornithorhynchus anatinus]|uniref:protein YAE1 homolog isoform X2 n=1 Tax=Ornithorhynchus anatinus TaxID=9258 RepID=UPI0010A94CAF|nr:protein YAE1 homolog isoform X2 [Ornithorhynchus anatinus]
MEDCPSIRVCTVDENLWEGYREGVDAGKAFALEQGFRQGYRQAAEKVLMYGQVRGTLSALLSWCQLQDNGSAAIGRINSLLDALDQCEDSALRCLTSVTSEVHVVDILDSIQDMDLCAAAPTQKREDGDEEGRSAEYSAELEKTCNKIDGGTDSSLSTAPRTWEHIRSTQENFTWIVQETSTLTEQLGIQLDILEHIKNLTS